MRNRGSSIVVRHTEYIADISSSTSNFNVNSYSINPGLNASFPWLSNVAANYESYLFKKLHYMYKPICPTNTPGKVILAIDYDAADATPSSKVVINSYESAASCSVWDQVVNRSTTMNMRKFGVQRYVRNTVAPTGTDIKTYDIGKLLVATSNTPNTATTLGELYVEYEIELYTPQLPPAQSVFDLPRVPIGPILMQLAKIAVSAAGVATLTAEYYDTPLFAILKQAIDAGKTIIDIGINPNVARALKFDLKNTASSSVLGRGPATAADRTPITYYVGDSGSTNYNVNIWAGDTGSYSRSFITTPAPSVVGTSDSTDYNPVPYFRVSTIPNAQMDINAYGIVGTPPAASFVNTTVISTGIPPPYVGIDWFSLPSSPSYYSDQNIMHNRAALSATPTVLEE